MVKFNSGSMSELKEQELVKMSIRERLIGKMKSLPADKLEEVAVFVQFLELKEKDQSGLAEYGMGDYLNQLSVYEEMLVTGKIKWS